MVGVAAGESKIQRKPFHWPLNRFSGEFCCSISCVFFIIGTLVSYDIHCCHMQPKVKILPCHPLPYCTKSGLGLCRRLNECVILSAILSAGNSGMYSSTRMLFDMAKEGVRQNGSQTGYSWRSHECLVCNHSRCGPLFPDHFYWRATGFNWLLNMSGMCGFIVWLGIAISHYRFRKGYTAQGYKIKDLAYRAKFFPFAPWFAFILCSIIILGQNYQAVLGGKIDWLGYFQPISAFHYSFIIWLAINGNIKPN